MDDFAHLHVHTEYSILDGAASVPKLVSRAVELGQTHLAQTDHGNMFGAYAFRKECLAQGVTPILGLEAYVAPSSRLNRGKETWGVNDEGREIPSGGSAYTHLTLLATNGVGLRNLFELSTASFTEGFYQKPRIDLTQLEALSRGLIIGSGCLSGELLARLQLGQHDVAEAYICKMKEMFGDQFFIEVMDHSFDRESRHLPELLDLARRYRIRAVATNDSHYTSDDDSILHDAMLCLGTNKKLDDPKRMRFDGSGYYLKSREEMARLSLPPESLGNTLWVAEQVESYDDVFAHRMELMPKWTDVEGWTAADRLRVMVGDALDKFFGSHMLHDDPRYDERAQHELDVICPAGFADYFLIVADGIQWAKSQGISVGVGRGSAAGSLVAYLLGVTGCDPIVHGLLFERFLNSERVSLPDVDVDFEMARRDEVLRYLTEKYGAENCARIQSVNVIHAKSALADSARILGRPFGAGKRVADKVLPSALFGVEPRLCEADMSKVDDREVFDLATSLEGLVRGPGMHAGGFVISPEALAGVLPLYVPARSSSEVATQWDMHAVEDLGLVKFDFLGLKNLDVMGDALAHVPGLSLPRPEEFTDDRTFALLQRGDTVGCFQLSGGSMRQLLKRVAPRHFDHLVATIALYRPGPMGVGAHHAFADRLNGREDVRYPSDELQAPLEDILGPTFGVIVYQEQVMQVLQRVCGYSLAQADLVRKAMGKKDRALLTAEHQRFLDGGLKNGFSRRSLDTLWETLLPFADYAFGKSHSTAYAYNAYWNAWLKANYPWEWMSALLTHASTASVLGKQSQAEQYVAEVARMGIPVLPPSINGGSSWTPGEKGIHYGINSIKGVGEKISGPLLRAAPYRGWADFLERAPKSALNVAAVKALISAGALDSFGVREGLLACYERAVAEAVAVRAERKLGRRGFGGVRRYHIPAEPVDWEARRVQELATLGVELSYPSVVVRVPQKGLDIDGWEFLRRTLDGCRGSSSATVAHQSWTYPTPFFVDVEKLPGLVKPLGVTVNYET